MAHCEAIPRDDLEVLENLQIGVAVEPSDQTTRALLLRKVYIVLLLQISSCFVVAAAMVAAGAQEWDYRECVVVADSLWWTKIPQRHFVLTLLVCWRPHEYPTNLVTLGVYTLFYALDIGWKVSVASEEVVLKAFAITTFLSLIHI